MSDKSLQLLNTKTAMKKMQADVSKILSKFLQTNNATNKDEIKHIVSTYITNYIKTDGDISKHFDIIVDVDQNDPMMMVITPQNFISALWLNGEHPNIDDVLDKDIWWTKFCTYKWDDENKKMLTSLTVSMEDVFGDDY